MSDLLTQLWQRNAQRCKTICQHSLLPVTYLSHSVCFIFGFAVPLYAFCAGPSNLSAPLPGKALNGMISRLPSGFPGAETQQDDGGVTLPPAGLPPLGRYTSVLNDGLFNSLQV